MSYNKPRIAIDPGGQPRYTFLSLAMQLSFLFLDRRLRERLVCGGLQI
jgi:hypothetical protein